MRDCLIRNIVFCVILAGVTHGADPPSVRRQVVEVPGISPVLQCRATRQGLVCRVEVSESLPYGETLELRLQAAEQGEWKEAELTTGPMLAATPGPRDGKAPGPADGVTQLKFHWKFPIDEDEAERLFDAEMAPLRKEAISKADADSLTGDRRDRFIETQLIALASDRANTLLESDHVVILDRLREIKNRRTAEGMLRLKRLTPQQHTRLIVAFVAEDEKQLRDALKDLPDFRQRMAGHLSEIEKNRKKKLTEKQKNEARASFLESEAFESMQKMRMLRQFEGWRTPGGIKAVRTGTERLRQICEWQAAELLFLQTRFPLDDIGLAHWQPVHQELLDWLLKRQRKPDEPYEFLQDEHREQLRDNSQVKYTVSFVPLLPTRQREQKQPHNKRAETVPQPDIGWTAAHRMGLKPDILGSILWTGTTATRPGFQSAWLQIDAPPGIRCELRGGAKDLTYCIVSGEGHTFLRIAPRRPNAAVRFEALVTHDSISGQRVRWEQRSDPGNVVFPF